MGSDELDRAFAVLARNISVGGADINIIFAIRNRNITVRSFPG